jgi:hypothetical protein
MSKKRPLNEIEEDKEEESHTINGKSRKKEKENL